MTTTHPDSFYVQLDRLPVLKILFFISLLLAVEATAFSYTRDYILAYGDAESHINIAKRVVDSITPGLAQLGGIWLPLPHLLMLPFVKSDFLWRSGLAGAIVSGILFVIASSYIYKLTLLLTKNKLAGIVAFSVFVTNPNILYLQSTPMTEIPLICFIIVSSYYMIHFLKTEHILSLLFAAFFGFCATLTRYDGWFLVIAETAILFARYMWKRSSWSKLESFGLLFCSLAFSGIVFWLAWDWIILGNPLYFTDSPYSAKSQQQSWLARGELPAYHDIGMSFVYYSVDSVLNIGVIASSLAIIGLLAFVIKSFRKKTILLVPLLLAPFLFNVITLYLGQSVIFIPGLTPDTFEWTLFNARYGAIMVPAAAVFIGILFKGSKNIFRVSLITLLIIQSMLFLGGHSKVLSWEDGVVGLSSAKRPDAEKWLNQNYDHGLVLMDDFARATSIIRSDIPMQNTIYVGNKPYWDDALNAPEKNVTWVVMQKNDTVWQSILANPVKEKNLYKYFNKVYTSPDIQIFKRIK